MKITELHRAAWAQLAARRAQLPHALLISGQRGIGKFDLARAFAAALLCERPTASGEACGTCAACSWLEQGNHPDFRLLQPDALAECEAAADAAGKKKPSQQITIDQVRGLDDFLHVGTHRQGMRVILINPAEAMNRATAKSLLKSLEEPIATTLFILVTGEADRLLPTIRSRCQAIKIGQPAKDDCEQWLRQAGVDDAARWLALAGGSPLLAVELVSSDEGSLLDALVGEMARGATLDPLAAAAALDWVIKAEKRPAPLKRLLEWAQKWLVDLCLSAENMPPRYFLAHADVLQSLARSTASVNLLAFNRKTLQYKLQCEQPLNGRLFLEDFFLNYAALFQNS